MQRWEFCFCMQNGLDVLKENELWFGVLICSCSVENFHLWMVTNFVTCFCGECAKFAMHLLQIALNWEFHCCVVQALLCFWQAFCVLLCFGSTEWNEVVTNWAAHFHHCNISKFVIFIHCCWIANFLRSAVTTQCYMSFVISFSDIAFEILEISFCDCSFTSFAKLTTQTWCCGLPNLASLLLNHNFANGHHHHIVSQIL